MLTMEEIRKAPKMRILDRDYLAKNLTAHECKELSYKMRVLHNSLANIDKEFVSAALSGTNPAAMQEIQVIYTLAALVLREMIDQIVERYLTGDEFITLIVYWCDYYESIETDLSYARVRSLARVHYELADILDDIGSILSACQDQ